MTPLSRNPFIINCKVNNVTFPFELDSGSHVSTLRLCDARKINASIVPSNIQVKGYSGSNINILGKTSVTVQFHDECVDYVFLIVESNHVNLLGRELARKLNINILLPDNTVNTLKYDIFSKFKDYLSDDFESNVRDCVTLKVKANAEPKFCKARSVPLRLKDSVKNELNRLIDKGILSKVFSSDWASPIVTARKNDGSLRICGDFSIAVNKHLDVVHAPLPTVK